MKLTDLFDSSLYNKMRTGGMVNRQYHPRLPLAILNYSHECQFAREWNDVTTQCRGLIYNVDTLEIVARPFPKFFNVEELGPSKVGQALGKNVEATDKMDGSLGVLYPDETQASGWAIATRGSFTSDQAIKGTTMLHDNGYGYMHYWTGGPLPGVTYLFEIIYPENRIVLNYGSAQALVLLATVITDTGEIGGPTGPAAMRWPGPVTEIFPATSLKEVRALPIRDNAEGFVLRNTKTGFMAKMKYEEYVRIHRIVFGMNEKRVHHHLRNQHEISELYIGVPEEFHPWIDGCIDMLMDQFWAIHTQAWSDYEYLRDLNIRSRKEAAAWIIVQKYPGLLFSLYDNKDITDSIWKMIPYDGRNKMATERSEDAA